MNRPVHFEFSSPDPRKEIDFFSGVFGWTTEKWGEMDYWLVTTGKDEAGIDGAIMPQAMPDQPRTVDTIGVDDIDETVKKALAAGATIALPKQEIPNMGWTIYLLSPTGILFGLYQGMPGAI